MKCALKVCMLVGSTPRDGDLANGYKSLALQIKLQNLFLGIPRLLNDIFNIKFYSTSISFLYKQYPFKNL